MSIDAALAVTGNQQSWDLGASKLRRKESPCLSAHHQSSPPKTRVGRSLDLRSPTEDLPRVAPEASRPWVLVQGVARKPDSQQHNTIAREELPIKQEAHHKLQRGQHIMVDNIAGAFGLPPPNGTWPNLLFGSTFARGLDVLIRECGGQPEGETLTPASLLIVNPGGHTCSRTGAVYSTGGCSTSLTHQPATVAAGGAT